MIEVAFVLACVAVIVLFVPRVVSGTRDVIALAKREKVKRHLDWVNPEPQRSRKRSSLRF